MHLILGFKKAQSKIALIINDLRKIKPCRSLMIKILNLIHYTMISSSYILFIKITGTHYILFVSKPV